MAVEHPKGTTIMVLGILGLVSIALCAVFAPFLGIPAWVMGNNAIHEIDMNPAAYTNRGAVQAGRICGIIATALFVVLLVLYMLFFVAAFSL
ncbi:MAG TPA: hypothetical protein VGJ86_13110 [Acidimicrobiales bacterium]|jgi:hypothetical protein